MREIRADMNATLRPTKPHIVVFATENHHVFVIFISFLAKYGSWVDEISCHNRKEPYFRYSNEIIVMKHSFIGDIVVGVVVVAALSLAIVFFFVMLIRFSSF